MVLSQNKNSQKPQTIQTYTQNNNIFSDSDSEDEHDVFDNRELDQIVDTKSENWAFKYKKLKFNFYNLYKARCAQWKGDREKLKNQEVAKQVKILYQGGDKRKSSFNLIQDLFDFVKDDYDYTLEFGGKKPQYLPQQQQQVQQYNQISQHIKTESYNFNTCQDQSPCTPLKTLLYTPLQPKSNNKKPLNQNQKSQQYSSNQQIFKHNNKTNNNNSMANNKINLKKEQFESYFKAMNCKKLQTFIETPSSISPYKRINTDRNIYTSNNTSSQKIKVRNLSNNQNQNQINNYTQQQQNSENQITPQIFKQSSQNQQKDQITNKQYIQNQQQIQNLKNSNTNLINNNYFIDFNCLLKQQDSNTSSASQELVLQSTKSSIHQHQTPINQPKQTCTTDRKYQNNNNNSNINISNSITNTNFKQYYNQFQNKQSEKLKNNNQQQKTQIQENSQQKQQKSQKMALNLSLAKQIQSTLVKQKRKTKSQVNISNPLMKQSLNLNINAPQQQKSLINIYKTAMTARGIVDTSLNKKKQNNYFQNRVQKSCENLYREYSNTNNNNGQKSENQSFFQSKLVNSTVLNTGSSTTRMNSAKKKTLKQNFVKQFSQLLKK